MDLYPYNPTRVMNLLRFSRTLGGLAMRYRNWIKVGWLFWHDRPIPLLRPRQGYHSLHFPLQSRPLVLMNEVWWQDDYELKKIGLLPDDVVVDIGANVGVFSWNVLTRFPGTIVHAIEPHPINFEFLCKNLSRFPATRCWNLAISGQEGLMDVFSPEWLDGVRLASIDSPLAQNPRWQHQGKVAVLPLSNFFKKAGIKHVALLKVDIEGAEVDLIPDFENGLLDIINRVVMECHEHQRPGLTSAFEDTLRAQNFFVVRRPAGAERFMLSAYRP
jgi:31-O-methyltransferase